jgi:uncharacterized DUF497 family protein
MKFEWDENKAARNLSKHEVSFNEAKTIFDDPLYSLAMSSVLFLKAESLSRKES